MELHGFFTDSGQALVSKLIDGTASLVITRILSGSGETAETDAALAAPQQTLAVNTPAQSSWGATISVTLTSASAAADYTLTELGVYAEDPEAGEILYKVYRLDEPAKIAAGSSSVLRFYLKETHSPATDITVNCSPDGLLTEAEFLPYLEKVNTSGIPAVTAVLDAAELQAYLDALPRYLNAHYTITVSGALDAILNVHRFFGNGSISIRAAALGDATFAGAEMIYCQVPVFFTKIQFKEPAGRENLAPLVRSNHSAVTLNSCAFVGGQAKAGAFGAEKNGRLIAENCTVSGYRCVAYASYGGLTTVCGAASSFTSCTTGACVWYGGLVIIGESTISGTMGASTNYKKGGGIITYSGTLA